MQGLETKEEYNGNVFSMWKKINQAAIDASSWNVSCSSLPPYFFTGFKNIKSGKLSILQISNIQSLDCKSVSPRIDEMR